MGLELGKWMERRAGQVDGAYSLYARRYSMWSHM